MTTKIDRSDGPQTTIGPCVTCGDEIQRSDEYQVRSDGRPYHSVCGPQLVPPETHAKTTDRLSGQTAFFLEHGRRPTAKRDGIGAWLRDQIDYLEGIRRTEFGDGTLSAYKSTLHELEGDYG